MKKKPCPTPWKDCHHNARIAARHIHAATADYGVPMYSYRCRCGWWHLTHQYQQGHTS